MITKDNLAKMFCNVDDFCIPFEEKLQKSLIIDGNVGRRRKPSMSYSELMTILITFQTVLSASLIIT